MANVISDETIEYVGILAKLELSEEDKEQAKKDMGSMLDYIDKLVESKRKVADKYKELFKNNEKVKFFIEPNNAKSNYWLNALLFNSKEDQQSFLKYTNDHGVMTRPTWRLMSNLPMYSKCQKDNLKNSQFLENCLVNIPSSPLFLGSVLK